MIYTRRFLNGHLDANQGITTYQRDVASSPNRKIVTGVYISNYYGEEFVGYAFSGAIGSYGLPAWSNSPAVSSRPIDPSTYSDEVVMCYAYFRTKGSPQTPGSPDIPGPDPVDPNPEPSPGTDPTPGPDPEPSPGGDEQDEFTVTTVANPEVGGTVTGAGTYAKGDICAVRVTAASGYRYMFSKVEPMGRIDTSTSFSFPVYEDETVTAYFSHRGGRTIMTTVSPAGSGTTTGDGEYVDGETCTIEATPAPGYEFLRWIREYDGSVYTDPQVTFTVERNEVWTAVFATGRPVYADTVDGQPGVQRTAIVTVVDEPSGAAASLSGGGTFPANGITNLNATAASGYYFMFWTNDRDSTILTSARQDRVGIPGDVTWTAVFRSSSSGSYAVAALATPRGGGTASGSGGYRRGDTAHLVATPSDGYSFTGWVFEDGTRVPDNPLDFQVTVSGPTTVLATFAPVGSRPAPADGGLGTVVFDDASGSVVFDG